jgi:hypothetical protein
MHEQDGSIGLIDWKMKLELVMREPTKWLRARHMRALLSSSNVYLYRCYQVREEISLLEHSSYDGQGQRFLWPMADPGPIPWLQINFSHDLTESSLRM